MRSMPTKPSPLLCELHAHTTWSDGALDVRRLCDLYGQSGFDVLAITDHATRDGDHVGAGRYDAYLAQIEAEAARAATLYGLLVIPGLELTYDDPDPLRSAHAVAIGLRSFVDVGAGLESSLASCASLGGGARRRPPVFAGSPRWRDAGHGGIRRPSGARGVRRPLRALQPRHAVRLGCRCGAAGDRQRRLPPHRPPGRLEDAAPVRAERGRRGRLPALAPPGVPRPSRRGTAPARGPR